MGTGKVGEGEVWDVEVEVGEREMVVGDGVIGEREYG